MQVSIADGMTGRMRTLVLEFAPTPQNIARVRTLPSRRMLSVGRWAVPYDRRSWDALRAIGVDLSRVPPPVEGRPAATAPPPGSGACAITAHRGLLKVVARAGHENTDALRRLPDYRLYDTRGAAWFAKPTRRNIEHLVKHFPNATWDAQADEWRRARTEEHDAATKALALAKASPLDALEAEAADDYKHGGPPPFDWQRRCFLMSRDAPAFAIFAEQRTGKSKVLIDTVARLYVRGRIKQALVIAPNSVKTVWAADALPEHMPSYISWKAAVWKAAPTRADRAAYDAVNGDVEQRGGEVLRWLVMNVEALSTDRGAAEALAFVKRAETLVAIDESTRIKTPRSRRTRACIRLRRWAPYRRVLTGTPATQGPLDLYAQFEFLDPNILGDGSFYAFRNRYAIMGGFNGKVVIGYQNLDQLQALIDPYSFRITRDECFDIPPKGYQRLVVEMAAEQSRLYAEMRDRMKAELGDGRKVTATMVLVQMLRLSQIAGGFVPAPETDELSAGRPDAVAIDGPNPKIAALVELAGDVVGKVVVWARFRAEIAAAAAALRAEYGEASVVEFHGDVKEDDRLRARVAFQDPGSGVRFFVGQTETGGLGIDLSQARTVVYLSNGFSLESRLQSEDRPMAGTQRHSVAVVDIIAKGTVDERVVGALRSKLDVARVITGDAWKEWI